MNLTGEMQEMPRLTEPVQLKNDSELVVVEDIAEDMASDYNEPHKVVIYEPPVLPKAYKQTKPDRGKKNSSAV
jgi:hypothetical protein